MSHKANRTSQKFGELSTQNLGQFGLKNILSSKMAQAQSLFFHLPLLCVIAAVSQVLLDTMKITIKTLTNAVFSLEVDKDESVWLAVFLCIEIGVGKKAFFYNMINDCDFVVGVLSYYLT